MKLESINIHNYRSITTTEKIDINNHCVLIGKNNEGKTNLLRAINLSLSTLKRYALRLRNPRLNRPSFMSDYIFDRDYPISLKNSNRSQPTKFTLVFSLDEDDRVLFLKETKMSNNGLISLEIVFPKQNRPTPILKVLGKKGRGSSSYNNNIGIIIGFLSNNIIYEYIPAIRTKENSLEVVGNLIRNQMAYLSNDNEYEKAVEVIASKRKELMDDLSQNVLKISKTFMPSINKISISLWSNDFDSSFDNDDLSFMIDDGDLTEIDYKGDGVKSVIAIALLYGSRKNKLNRIIAIEEPESHLHYDAIHQLDNVLRDLSRDNQVIVSTHNPIFVNTKSIQSNIIIDNGKAKKAKSVSEIRSLLGIKIFDSLYFSQNVIVLEGTDDITSFKHIICLINPRLKEAIEKKDLCFTDCSGCGNLTYQLSFLSNMLLNSYVVVDGDNAGKTAIKNAKERGLLDDLRCSFLSAYGFGKESEFEDFVKKEVYADYIQKNYGVNLAGKAFNSSKKKWSDRLADAFRESGKVFDEKTEAVIKSSVASMIESKSSIDDILSEYNKAIFSNIANSIELFFFNN